MTHEPRSLSETIAQSATNPFVDGTLAVSDGTILDADEAAAALLSLERERLPGEPLSCICPSSPTVYGAESLMDAIERSVETGDGFE